MQDISILKKIIVTSARKILLPRFSQSGRFRIKKDGSFITESDYLIQKEIEIKLYRYWPQINFFSEEMDQQKQKKLLLQTSKTPLWCLDPLDGTRNFIAGIPYFCISLALFQNGKIKLGIVYDPIRDEFFNATLSKGAFLNGIPLKVKETYIPIKQAIALVDFKRLSKKILVRLIQETPYASQRSFGSVALDWCWLAAGRVHLYLHGSSHLWDYAAGNFIHLLAGGKSITLEGEDIFTKALIPRSCVGASNEELFNEWINWLGINKSREKN